MDFVRFVSYQSITCLTFGSVDSCRSSCLLDYAKLKSLTCEEYREMNLNEIMRFAMGKKGELEHLSVSLSRLRSTTDMLPPELLPSLKSLYLQLADASRFGVIRSGLRNGIYFAGVSLEFSIPFECYGFTAKLIDLHRQRSVWQACPSVNQVDYLNSNDLFYDEFYDHSTYLQPNQPPAEEHLRFGRFIHLYPNIQIVVLDNSSELRPTVDQKAFLCFLQSCRALVKLLIRCACLPSEFYDQLAKLPSLAELRSLILFEQIGAYPELVRLGHLLSSFKQLRYLSTNLATCDLMLDLVARMPKKASFEFAFWCPRANVSWPNSDWFQFNFLPIAGAPVFWHKLRLEQFKLNVPNFKRELFTGFFTTNNLRAAFSQASVRKLASTWLDFC